MPRRRLPPADGVRRGKGGAPTIISESGRAIVAHHSLLVPNVPGSSRFGTDEVPAAATAEMERPLVDLIETYTSLNVRNALESYHDAQQALDMAINMFSTGYLPLVQRSQAESLYWAICMKLQKLVKTMEEVPEDLQHLDESLSDTYFFNFHCFSRCQIAGHQAAVPDHADSPLNEQPTRHAVLGDITCDSDGKVDQFIDRRDVRRTLRSTHSTARRITLASFWSVPTRRFSATCIPLRRHPRGAREPRCRQPRRARHGHQGRYRSRGAVIRAVRWRCADQQAANDVETAVRDGRIDYEESGRLVQFFEDGLRLYVPGRKKNIRVGKPESESTSGRASVMRNKSRDPKNESRSNHPSPESPIPGRGSLDLVVDNLHVREQPRFRRGGIPLIFRRHRSSSSRLLDALAGFLSRAHSIGNSRLNVAYSSSSGIVMFTLDR